MREMEAVMPDSARLITREYEDLYTTPASTKSKKRIGMTRQELALNWILTVMYVAFGIGIILTLVF